MTVILIVNSFGEGGAAVNVKSEGRISGVLSILPVCKWLEQHSGKKNIKKNYFTVK